MNAQMPASLHKALQLSVRMLEAGHAQQWDQVANLKDELDQALREVGRPSAEMREALALLATQQRQLAEQALGARQAIGDELGKHKYKQRAVHAYLSPGGKR